MPSEEQSHSGGLYRLERMFLRYIEKPNTFNKSLLCVTYTRGTQLRLRRLKRPNNYTASLLRAIYTRGTKPRHEQYNKSVLSVNYTRGSQLRLARLVVLHHLCELQKAGRRIKIYIVRITSSSYSYNCVAVVRTILYE